MQVFWAYITGMLSSLGKMKLERIHSMLRMFASQGKECSEVGVVLGHVTLLSSIHFLFPPPH